MHDAAGGELGVTEQLGRLTTMQGSQGEVEGGNSVLKSVQSESDAFWTLDGVEEVEGRSCMQSGDLIVGATVDTQMPRCGKARFPRGQDVVPERQGVYG